MILSLLNTCEGPYCLFTSILGILGTVTFLAMFVSLSTAVMLRALQIIILRSGLGRTDFFFRKEHTVVSSKKTCSKDQQCFGLFLNRTRDIWR
jgi:hypothetical protein